jgi:hypothetical protein
MNQVSVTLDFACCACYHSVSVTVNCAGKGLAEDSPSVAAVNVPCPTCGLVNQLYFEPNGTVHAVAPYNAPRPVPQPSLN